ncbi:hypothetical protein AKG34_21340 [Peribacillus butanolivorans]|uniref:hypothetical protein n=1 Tax=Peribacillus butanolivorans TaxID=421767 RepID=UPI0006A70D96|nr:hypothetical protein [Peribacillus butanolivorans]KON67366.1 hypothetical protein AKG34_21340 [Peribacillus butanolivorans]
MESEKLKYEIPRNVKAGGLFLKLDWKGWISFISVSSFFTGIAFLLFRTSFTTFIIAGFVVLITYFTFEIDEKTGYANYQNISLMLNKGLMNKRLTPKWGGTENEDKNQKQVIYINVKTKK